MFRQLLAISIVCFLAVIAHSQDSSPQPKAHAHNDYEHDRPLLDALDQGFCSVEADVFAIDGELRVGHYRVQTKPGKTLQKLYLEPLRKLAQKNEGRIHKDGPQFYLLIDFKTKAEPTYELLKPVLEEYRDLLVVKEEDKAPAMQIVISGNRPFDLIKAEDEPLCGIDGRLSDLDSDKDEQFMPLISDNWGNHFKWRGEGEMPVAERKKLHEAVEKAHTANRRIRFWATPESEALWKELLDADVDHINTDELARLKEFLISEN